MVIFDDVENSNRVGGNEGGIRTIFVQLTPNAPLPSEEYLRLVALSKAPPPPDSEGSTLHSARNCRERSARVNGRRSPTKTNVRPRPPVTATQKWGDNAMSLINSKEEAVQRHEFALHVRGARYCRLLETMLDSSDLQVEPLHYDPKDPNMGRRPNGTEGNPANSLPPVILPQATQKGCVALFTYLDLITKRVPSMLSKPLRAPLEELVQPWELEFLLYNCMGDDVRNAITHIDEDGTADKRGRAPTNDTRPSYYSTILEKAPQSVDLLLEVALLSDFLLVEPLRQLTCAFIASLALNASSEEELLQLSGLQRPMTEDELEPLYYQFPFLRPDNHAKN